MTNQLKLLYDASLSGSADAEVIEAAEMLQPRADVLDMLRGGVEVEELLSRMLRRLAERTWAHSRQWSHSRAAFLPRGVPDYDGGELRDGEYFSGRRCRRAGSFSGAVYGRSSSPRIPRSTPETRVWRAVDRPSLHHLQRSRVSGRWPAANHSSRRAATSTATSFSSYGAVVTDAVRRNPAMTTVQDRQQQETEAEDPTTAMNEEARTRRGYGILWTSIRDVLGKMPTRGRPEPIKTAPTARYASSSLASTRWLWTPRRMATCPRSIDTLSAQRPRFSTNRRDVHRRSSGRNRPTGFGDAQKPTSRDWKPASTQAFAVRYHEAGLNASCRACKLRDRCAQLDASTSGGVGRGRGRADGQDVVSRPGWSRLQSGDDEVTKARFRDLWVGQGV